MAIQIHMVYDPDTNSSRIDKAELVPPFEIRNGIRVELVDGQLLRDIDSGKLMNMLGLVSTGESAPERDAVIYVRKKHYWIYKTTSRIRNAYYPTIWWLYIHGRVFQPIPEWEMFRWRYLTPIYLISKLWSWISWQVSPEHPSNKPIWM